VLCDKVLAEVEAEGGPKLLRRLGAQQQKGAAAGLLQDGCRRLVASGQLIYKAVALRGEQDAAHAA
jgi:hypothetical protein